MGGGGSGGPSSHTLLPASGLPPKRFKQPPDTSVTHPHPFLCPLPCRFTFPGRMVLEQPVHTGGGSSWALAFSTSFYRPHYHPPPPCCHNPARGCEAAHSPSGAESWGGGYDWFLMVPYSPPLSAPAAPGAGGIAPSSRQGCGGAKRGGGSKLPPPASCLLGHLEAALGPPAPRDRPPFFPSPPCTKAKETPGGVEAGE